MFAVHDDKLFSGMCKWSNHCLHHLLPIVNVTLDTILGIEDILINWFLIIFDVALLFICCLIRYLLTSFSWFVCTPVRDVTYTPIIGTGIRKSKEYLHKS